MKIEVKHLSEQIEKIKKVFVFKGILDFSNKIMIKDNFICASNDLYTIFLKTDLNIEGIFDFDRFYQVVSYIKDDFVKIDYLENNFLQIKAKKNTIKIKNLDVDCDYLLDIIRISKEITEYKKLPSNFNQAIKLCLFSVSNTRMYPILNNICINGNKMYSSDSLRIGYHKLDSDFEKYFLIPKESSLLLSSEEINNYCIVKDLIFFKKDDVFICSRIGFEKFPDIHPFFEEKGGFSLSFPEEMKETSEFLSKLSTDTFFKKNLVIHCNKNEITIESEFHDLYFSYFIETEQELDNFKFIMNPDFLSEILHKKVMRAKVFLEKNRILFYNKNFNHLIALIHENK